jgi:hypothetical protein
MELVALVIETSLDRDLSGEIRNILSLGTSGFCDNAGQAQTMYVLLLTETRTAPPRSWILRVDNNHAFRFAHPQRKKKIGVNHDEHHDYCSIQFI